MSEYELVQFEDGMYGARRTTKHWLFGTSYTFLSLHKCNFYSVESQFLVDNYCHGASKEITEKAIVRANQKLHAKIIKDKGTLVYENTYQR